MDETTPSPTNPSPGVPLQSLESQNIIEHPPIESSPPVTPDQDRVDTTTPQSNLVPEQNLNRSSQDIIRDIKDATNPVDKRNYRAELMTVISQKLKNKKKLTPEEGKLTPEELEQMAEDLVDLGLDSSVAQARLKRESRYSNIQKMMNQYGFDEISYTDDKGIEQVITVDKKGLEKLPPWVRNAIIKVGVSGATVVTAGVMFGSAPLTLPLAIAFGGSAAGTFIGSWLRARAEKSLKEQEIKGVISDSVRDVQAADKLLKTVQEKGQENVEYYQNVEELVESLRTTSEEALKARGIRGSFLYNLKWGLFGAGLSAAGSGVALGAFELFKGGVSESIRQLVEQAGQEGILLKGREHIIKKISDVWRWIIEQKDVDDIVDNTLNGVKNKWTSYAEKYFHYATSTGNEVVQLQVPAGGLPHAEESLKLSGQFAKEVLNHFRVQVISRLIDAVVAAATAAEIPSLIGGVKEKIRSVTTQKATAQAKEALGKTLRELKQKEQEYAPQTSVNPDDYFVFTNLAVEGLQNTYSGRVHVESIDGDAITVTLVDALDTKTNQPIQAKLPKVSFAQAQMGAYSKAEKDLLDKEKNPLLVEVLEKGKQLKPDLAGLEVVFNPISILQQFQGMTLIVWRLNEKGNEIILQDKATSNQYRMKLTDILPSVQEFKETAKEEKQTFDQQREIFLRWAGIAKDKIADYNAGDKKIVVEFFAVIKNITTNGDLDANKKYLLEEIITDPQGEIIELRLADPDDKEARIVVAMKDVIDLLRTNQLKFANPEVDEAPTRKVVREAEREAGIKGLPEVGSVWVDPAANKMVLITVSEARSDRYVVRGAVLERDAQGRLVAGTNFFPPDFATFVNSFESDEALTLRWQEQQRHTQQQGGRGRGGRGGGP